MKCLHCGQEAEALLCLDCRTERCLSALFDTLLFFKPEACENPHICAYAASLPAGTIPRDAIPQLLALFPDSITEYYHCLYARAVHDPRFEEMALAYLDSHDSKEENCRRVLQKLLDFYLRNEFIKPRKWCNLVREEGLAGAELITLVIQNYSMTGEYALADEMLNKALEACRKGETQFLYGVKDQERLDRHVKRLEKLAADNERYQTARPYWPNTEERRRAVALLYDEKGISYPRIESKPAKVLEGDFKPLVEHTGSTPGNYCTFWCAAGFSATAVKSIYEIAAVKVKSDKITDQFQSYVRVWDGASARKVAAKDGGIPLEVLESAEDVDMVMKRFFAFVGNCVLVSTDALGGQAKLISRAARYAGMTEIKNHFLDLLDLVEDILPDLDPTKNSREALLGRFGLSEGKDALAKAEANHKLFQKLKAVGA